MIWKCSLFACHVFPKQLGAEKEMVHIFSALLHDWKMLGIKWKAVIQVCAKVNASTFFFFFFAGMQRLEKTLFLCTYQRWGNENNVEWMQGLRAPCPACADESQRPDLIHTPGSNEQKLMHSCRKVLVHAQSPQKTASVAQNYSLMVWGIMWHQLFKLIG